MFSKFSHNLCTTKALHDFFQKLAELYLISQTADEILRLPVVDSPGLFTARKCEFINAYA